MTKLQKLEAAARKWAAVHTVMLRQAEIDQAAQGKIGAPFKCSADFLQLNSDETDAHMELQNAALELAR